MLFFADSTYLIALYDPRDNYNPVANKITQALLKHKFVKNKKQIYLSNLILAEVMNHVLKKHKLEQAKRIYQDLISNYSMVIVDIKIVQQGFQDVCCRYWKQKGRTLGLTDGTSVVVMRNKHIGLLLSFDDGFDAVVGIRRLSSVDEIEEMLRYP